MCQAERKPKDLAEEKIEAGGDAAAWGLVLKAVTEKLDRIEDKLDTLRQEHLKSAKEFLEDAQYAICCPRDK